jgi:hypothetical protein
MMRAVLALVLVLGVGAVSAQTDPAVGTWKFNPAKSKYDPGPAPKAYTVVVTAAGEGRLRVSGKGEAADGTPITVEYTAATDRKDVPVKGSPAYDTLSSSRIDPNTTQQTRKKGGKVVQTATIAVSSDGKTLTATTTGTDERGRKINTVAVFEKQ